MTRGRCARRPARFDAGRGDEWATCSSSRSRDRSALAGAVGRVPPPNFSARQLQYPCPGEVSRQAISYVRPPTRRGSWCPREERGRAGRSDDHKAPEAGVGTNTSATNDLAESAANASTGAASPAVTPRRKWLVSLSYQRAPALIEQFGGDLSHARDEPGTYVAEDGDRDRESDDRNLPGLRQRHDSPSSWDTRTT